MAKFTIEEKLKAVKHYLNGNESQKTSQILSGELSLFFKHGFNSINFMGKLLRIQSVHVQSIHSFQRC